MSAPTSTRDVLIKARAEGDRLDNSGRPRREYFERLTAMTDDELFAHTEQQIWLSAFADNNPRSDYHWHTDACYDEAKSRGNVDLYQRAWEAASRSAS